MSHLFNKLISIARRIGAAIDELLCLKGQVAETAEEVAQLLRCAGCGAELEEGARYCEKCREKNEPAR